MKTMAISEFKAHALKVLNEVAKSQETIVITKRGKPLAQVVPFEIRNEASTRQTCGCFCFRKGYNHPAWGRIVGSMSMKYLLDTHTWVWWNMRPQNLSRKVTKLIENADSYDELLLSAHFTLGIQ